MPTYQIQFRTDTTVNWNTENPVLLRGELGLEEFEDGSRAYKLGDGLTPWVDLDYCSGLPGKDGKDGRNGASGSQGPKGDTPPLSNSVISTSQTDAASSYAVKIAHDKAVGAQNTANAAKTAASTADAKAVAAQNTANTATAAASGAGMPSGRYIHIGTASIVYPVQYTAPANGYLQCGAYTAGDAKWFGVCNITQNNTSSTHFSDGNIFHSTIPAKKGEKLAVTNPYNAGISYIKFIYAEGAQ